MMKLLKKYKLELQLLFLMIVTLNCWFYKTDDYKYAFIVYCLIFLYLMIKQKSISYFVVVCIFSIMSLQNDSAFKIDYSLVIILFFYVLLVNIKNKYFAMGKLFIPLVVYFLYQLLSLLWTPVKSFGIYGLMAVIEGYAIYYIITNGRFKVKKHHLLDISKIATFIMLTLSAEIFYNYHIYGFEKVIHSKNLVDLGFSYSNFIAVIFVLLIPIALYKYLDKKHYYIGYFLLDLLNIFGLLLTLSRGAILGFAFSLLLFILLLVRKRFLLRFGTIIAGICIIIYKNERFNLYFNLVKDKYLTKEFVNDNGRFSLYELGWNRFLENKWFGDGIKSSKYMINHYLGTTSGHYHNFIIQIGATLGIVGLILFLIVVLRWLRVLFKPRDTFVLCSTISIIGALSHQQVDVSFDYFYFGLIFYSILGIVEIYRHSIKDDLLNLKIYQKH
ncbi:O-antigen ligase family protein [Mycoplasmatota bacterium]|nr:O-antigen ligase family protein [Mycoplasmatota bacterium]